MIESGEVDKVSTVSTMDITRLQDNSDRKVMTDVSSRVYYMAMDNLDAPLDDVNVRRAINYAVNKEGMIAPIFNNMVSLMKSNLLTKAVGGFHANEPYYYNPDKARELLAASGWRDTDGDGFVDKNGQTMHLKMVNREGYIAGDTELPELVQGMLKDVGIKVTIEVVDGATLLSNMNQERSKVPQYDLIYFSWATFGGNADYTLKCGYATSAYPPQYWNYAWYSNPEVDRLIEEGDAATDLAVQNAKFARAQEIAWDEACNLFLYEALASAVMAKNVGGIYLDPSQSIWPAKYAWISK
jgi:ABC-type transport system substrate-binding protein